MFYLKVWDWKLVYISKLLVVLLGYRYFRLEDTLKFIEIDCKVIDAKQGYIIFRVDCNIQIIPFIHEKQEDTSSSTRDIAEGKFYK